MFKRYRVKYFLRNGMYILEYCFRKRKECLWELHQAEEIEIVSCTFAGRSVFWYCLTNQRFILN
jgi:hypothetical protein